MDEFINKIDRLIIFFVVYTLVFYLIFGTLNYTLPFALALVFSMIISKPTKFIIKKFKIKNSIASLITTSIFFILLVAILAGIIAGLTKEVVGIAKGIQVYISNNSNDISHFFNKLYKYYNNLDPVIISNIEKNISSSLTKISNLTVKITSGALSGLLSLFSSVPYMIMLAIFTVLSTFHFTKDMSAAKEKVLDMIPLENSGKILYTIREARKMLGNYILSYVAIYFITFLVTLTGFSIIGVDYAVTISIISAILDIMPVLGISVTYIPVSIFYFLSGNYFIAFGVLILFVIAAATRQIVEPKIVSTSLGIHPVAILAALFIGLKANGVMGMFFCVFLVVFYNVFKKIGVL